MKELSIEENIKAYTELINRLEDVKDAIKKQNYGIAMDILYKPYPEFQITTSTELKENEDEKIRKQITGFITYSRVLDETKKNWLAWLEKQGERANFREKIQVGDKVTRNEDGVLVNLSQLKRVVKKKEKQGEKKPAWSEEDEKQARQIERIISNDGCTKKLQEQIHNWFESLKDRVQSKRERSEEDERYTNIVVSALSSPYLERLYHFNDVKSNDIINWFESLKDKYTWKPSDEQIKAIRLARSFVVDDFDEHPALSEILIELEEQLKKLKE